MSNKWSRHGSGVSVSQVGQSWRFRWKVSTDGAWKSREKMIPMSRCDVHQRDRVVILIREALATSGAVPADFASFLDPVIESPAASLVDGIDAYAKHAPLAKAASSKENNASHARQILPAIYKVLGVPTSRPLPVTVLSRDLFLRMQASGMRSTAQKLRFLLRAWQWMYGDLGAYPKTPPPPTGERTTEYVPSRDKYVPTKAPTFAHSDAMLRALGRSKASEVTKMAALWARYLGCRISEVFPVMRHGIDLDAGTVFVPGTKNESAPRTIPLPAALLAEPGVMAWIEAHPGPMFPTESKRPKIDEPVRLAWLDATARGECPREVWDPSAVGLRKIARPDHALRACVTEHLRRAKVDPAVRNRILGRKGGVEETHYSGDLEVEMQEAMATLPTVNWSDPQARADNVVDLATARR